MLHWLGFALGFLVHRGEKKTKKEQNDKKWQSITHRRVLRLGILLEFQSCGVGEMIPEMSWAGKTQPGDLPAAPHLPKGKSHRKSPTQQNRNYKFWANFKSGITNSPIPKTTRSHKTFPELWVTKTPRAAAGNKWWIELPGSSAAIWTCPELFLKIRDDESLSSIPSLSRKSWAQPEILGFMENVPSTSSSFQIICTRLGMWEWGSRFIPLSQGVSSKLPWVEIRFFWLFSKDIFGFLWKPRGLSVLALEILSDKSFLFLFFFLPGSSLVWRIDKIKHNSLFLI